MTAANFERCLSLVLSFEGSFTDDPRDKGGPTNLGITQSELARWRGHPVTKDDVRYLTHAEAAAIYRAHYWDEMRCDDLPSGIDLAVFDCAVNQGAGRAKRFLQRAAGVTADGIIGPKTLAAVRNADVDVILNEFMALRMQSYASLTTLFKTFGLGWSRRLMAIHTAAILI